MTARPVSILASTLALAAVLLLAGGASVAHASGSGPLYDASYNQQLTELVDMKTPTTSGGQVIRPTVPQWFRQEIAPEAAKLGRLPSFVKVAGDITLAATAFDFGWKIGRTIDTQWLHLEDPDCIIFGCPSAPPPGSVAPYNTVVPEPFGPICMSTGCSLTGVGAAWQYAASSTSGLATVAYNGDNYDGQRFANCPGACSVPSDMQVGGRAWNAGIAAGFSAYVEGTVNSDCGFGAYSGVSGCEGLYKVDGAVTPALEANGPPEPYTNQTPVNLATTMSPAPPSELTAGQRSTVINDITSMGQTSIDETNCLLDVSYPCPGQGNPGGAQVTVPEPTTHELASTYEADLTQAGFTAQPRVQTLTTPDPGFGPDEVIQVRPEPGTQTAPDTLVNLEENPDTAPCPAGDVTCGGVLNGGGGGCGVTPPGLDLTAFDSVAVSNKFPFGLFAWMYQGIAGIDGSSSVPSFSIPLLGSQVTGHSSLPVDLSILNPFMEIFRECVLIICTFGFIYWFSTSFLGFVDWPAGEQGTLF